MYGKHPKLRGAGSNTILRFPPGIGSVTTQTEATDYLQAALQTASVAHGVSVPTSSRRFADLHPATVAA